MTKENVRAFQISGKKIAGNEYGGLPCAPQSGPLRPTQNPSVLVGAILDPAQPQLLSRLLLVQADPEALESDLH